MAAQTGFGDIASPATVDEAVAALGRGARPLAGATWILRAPLRHETVPASLVSLHRIAGLHGLHVGPEQASLGAMTTHDALVAALSPHADLGGIAAAAGNSANPGIRRIATLGGNIATAAFAASDLVPALLAADATVVVASHAGIGSMPIAAYLDWRDAAAQGGLVLRVEIARSARRAAHARLPMRKAGDYACAIVSVSAEVSGGRIADLRIAVGAVEASARRWTALEDRLTGTPFDPARAEAEARGLTGTFAARDAVDAPGWYRLSVLPVLLRRAFVQLQAEV